MMPKLLTHKILESLHNQFGHIRQKSLSCSTKEILVAIFKTRHFFMYNNKELIFYKKAPLQSLISRFSI